MKKIILFVVLALCLCPLTSFAQQTGSIWQEDDEFVYHWSEKLLRFMINQQYLLKNPTAPSSLFTDASEYDLGDNQIAIAYSNPSVQSLPVLSYYSSGNLKSYDNGYGVTYTFLDEDYYGYYVTGDPSHLHGQGRISKWEYVYGDGSINFKEFEYWGNSINIKKISESVWGDDGKIVPSARAEQNYYNESFIKHPRIVTDSQGNTIMATLVIGDGGSCKAYVVKCNASGAILWRNEFPVNTNSAFNTVVTVDDSNNVYVAAEKYNGTNTDLVVYKFDSTTGSQVGSPFQLNLDGWESVSYISVDSANNIIISGTTDTGDWNHRNLFIVKLNSNLTEIWRDTYDSSYNDYGGYITIDAYDAITLYGNAYDNPDSAMQFYKITYGPTGIRSSPVSDDRFQVRYNATWYGCWETGRDSHRTTIENGVTTEWYIYGYKQDTYQMLVMYGLPNYPVLPSSYGDVLIYTFINTQTNQPIGYYCVADNGVKSEVIPTDDGNNGIKLTKVYDIPGDDSTYWFLWGDNVYEGQSNVVIELSIGGVWTAYTFTPDTQNLETVVNKSLWMLIGTVSDPQSLVLPELGGWWQWCANNNIVPEFPPLSSQLIDTNADGKIDMRHDTNDFMNTDYTYTWDYQASGNMKMVIMYDYNSDGVKEDIYSAVYDNGTDWDVKNIKTWTLLSDTYYLSGDTTNIYYASGMIESKTLSSPDSDGNIYYHYLDEDWVNQGYGRVDKRISAEPDTDGARAFTYTFWANTSHIWAENRYQNVDFTNLIVTNEYEAVNFFEWVMPPTPVFTTGNDFIIDFGMMGLLKYENGIWMQLSSWDPIMPGRWSLGSARLIDFGEHGLYKYEDGDLTELSPWQAYDILYTSGSSMVIDFGEHGLYKYEDGDLTELSPWQAHNILYIFDSNMVVDFGPLHGIWKYNNDSWSQLCSESPDQVYSYAPEFPILAYFESSGFCSLTESGLTKLSQYRPENSFISNDYYIFDLGVHGLWKYTNNQLSMISEWNPESISDVWDGNKQLVFIDFGSHGLWCYDDNALTLISSADPVFMQYGGPDQLYIDFGEAGGLYKYSSGMLTQISSFGGVYRRGIISMGSDTIIDFGASRGIWKYSSGVLSKIFSLGGAQGWGYSGTNGVYVLTMEFGEGNGMWKYENNVWAQISEYSSEGSYGYNNDTYYDFGPHGLWKYSNGVMTQLSAWNPCSITFSSGGTYLIVDFGALGLYKYENSVWTLMNSESPFVQNDLTSNSAYLFRRTLPDGTIYEYDDTNVHDNGTPSNPSDDYGHLVKETRPNGTYKIFSEHFNADQWRFIREYSALNSLLVTYEYYFPSGRMYKKTLPDGTIYEYDNTNVHDNGTPLNPIDDYGHLIRETRPDGTYKIFSEHFNADQWRFIKEYTVADALIVTYEYYESSGRLKTEERPISYEFGPTPKHTKKYFADEDLGAGYGFIYRIDNITDGYYYDINNTVYGPDPSMIKKDLATDEIIMWIYWTERYLSGNIKRVANTNLGHLFEYDDVGNIILYTSTNWQYTTLGWGTNSVLETIYAGLYNFNFQDPVLADVVQGERRTEYLYDTQGGSRRMTGKTIYSTDGVTILEAYTYYLPSGRLKTEERLVSYEFGSSKHTKKYFTDENLGSGYGFVYRIDNITDGYYYDINNAIYGPGPSKVKKDLVTNEIIKWIEWTEFYPDGSLKRVFGYGDVHEYADGHNMLYSHYGEYEVLTYGIGSVLRTIYDGQYSINFQDPILADVVQSERRTEYLYDTQDGNWRMIGKTLYSTDGVTILEAYTYYLLSGRMHTNTTSSGVTYEYDDTAFNDNGTSWDPADDYGRLIKTSLPDGTIYTYYASSGRFESTTLTTQDVYGNLYYHHIDEGLQPSVIIGFEISNGSATLTFTTVAGCDYAVEYSSSIYGPWNTVATMTAVDGITTYTGFLAYYRIVTFYGPNYGRVDKQVLASIDGDGAIAYSYEYFPGSSSIKVKRCYSSADYSNPSYPNLTSLIAMYKYDSSGNILSRIYHDIPEARWHKLSNFATKADGVHAQRDEIYTGIDINGNPTGFAELNNMTFYDSGNINTKVVFDNASGTKNNNYKKYTYADAPGYPLTEEVYYSTTDSKWHVKSDFTEVLGDGQRHAQREEIYDSIEFEKIYDINGRITRTIFSDGHSVYNVYDGQSIQNAINNASAGDTIYVHAGTYNERIVLSNGINLVGEDRATTIINGGYQTSSHIIRALGNNRIEGLTISGGGPYAGVPASAIRIEGDNISIRNNNLTDNRDYAIFVWNGGNILIEQNLFSNNNLGVQLPSSSTIIQYNTFVNNNISINVLNGPSTVIRNNIITGSTFQSIYEFSWGAYSSGQPASGYAIVEGNVLYNNAERGGYYCRCLPPAVINRTLGNLVSNPLFVDPATGNYSVPENSPAYGIGAFLPQDIIDQLNANFSSLIGPNIIELDIMTFYANGELNTIARYYHADAANRIGASVVEGMISYQEKQIGASPDPYIVSLIDFKAGLSMSNNAGGITTVPDLARKEQTLLNKN